jgi:hypothetical protein
MSKTNLSLIDLKSLSKPAEKLIEAVSSAVGILYEPRRIRNKAKAEADAAIILATGDAKAEEILFRARERLLHAELRRQANLESIVGYALDELPGSVSDNPVDEDWIHHFVGNCEDISNEQMQLLWARVLAGEVSSPGRFSKRFLEFMKYLGMKEAVLISEFYRYVWLIETEESVSAVYLNDDLIYMNAPSKRKGPFVPYSLRMEMSHLGLIHENLCLTVDRQKRVDFAYQNQRFFSENNNYLPYEIPVDWLSTIGVELLAICEPVEAPEYRDACVNQYQLVPVESTEN